MVDGALKGGIKWWTWRCQVNPWTWGSEGFFPIQMIL